MDLRGLELPREKDLEIFSPGEEIVPRMFVSLWHPVAPCGTGVVGPKERLLQSQTAVSEAWSPVAGRLGCWD